jgi:hypothetical protein
MWRKVLIFIKVALANVLTVQKIPYSKVEVFSE